MKVEKVSVEDVFRIAGIERLCFSDPWPVQGFTAIFDNPMAVFLAAHEDNDISGYIAGIFDGENGYIDKLAVIEGRRRRGVAEMLLKEFEQALPDNAVDIVLDVRVSNEGAIAFYKAHGFSVIGSRRDFYEKPREDGYVMRKILNRRGGFDEH